MRAALGVLLSAVVLLAGGCGDGEGDGDVAPVDRIVEELEANGMEPDLARCMGDAYDAAGFTLEDLERLADAGIDANSEKYQEFAEAAGACTSTGATAG